MITRVEIVDFLSHRDTTLEFGTGMNVIVGPNGAGKSSIVDAITFALFGEHTRGLKNSLIRRKTDDGYAKVEFRVGRRLFDVTRKIKSGSTAVLREKRDGTWHNVAAGERKHMGESTKHEVEKTLGMDFETLQIASIIRQGELGQIVHDGPKAFKTRINGIIGLDTLDTAHGKMGELTDLFRGRIRKETGYDDTHIATLDSKIAAAEAGLTEAKSQTEALRRSKDELSARVSDLSRRLETVREAASAKEQWDKRMADLRSYVRTERDGARSKITQLDGVITECKDALERRRDGAGTGERAESHRRELESAESEISSLATMLASLREKLDMSKRLVLQDGKCPVCDSHVSELNPLFVASHISEEIAKISGELDRYRGIAASSKQEIAGMQVMENRMAAAEATLRAHSINDVGDITQLVQEMARLKDVCNAADSCIGGDWRAAKTIDEQAKTYCGELIALESKIDKDAPRIDDVRNELKEARRKSDEVIAKHGAAQHRVRALDDEISAGRPLKKELETVGAYVKRLDRIKDVFSRDGVVAISYRSWALTTISNACTEYLAVLDTRISRITLSEKKRSVEIACHAGVETFGIDSLSGGEQICVALALRLGMARLLGTSWPAFVILDEPTAHLDADRRKSMAHVLGGLASATEAGAMQFIVITHDRDIFDESPVERRYELDIGPDGTRVYGK